MLDFIKKLFTHFSNSNTFEKGAALAYYTVFSFLPMIVIVISLLGIFFGEAAVNGELFTQLQSVLGEDGAKQIEDILKQQQLHHNSFWTATLSFLMLALSATGMFNQIHASFNAIWEIKSKPRSSLLNYAQKHFVSFSILIIIGFLLLSSTAISSFFMKHAPAMINNGYNTFLLDHLVSFLAIALMFTLMYRFLGDAIVHWKVALTSGAFTAALFLAGKILISIYIAHSKLSSMFGAASVIALLMVWVYYTSQIIFLGASFAYIFGKKEKLNIIPNEDAVRVVQTELEREEKG